MASELEPYPELPGEEAMSPEGLQVQRGNAQWAKRFEGGTTNLAQRARHAQQIRDYTASFEERRAIEQAHRIATDKDAANFYIRSRQLDLNEAKAEFDIADKIRKADAAALMAPTIKRAKIAATNAQIANAERLAREAELKDRIQADADLFHAAVADAELTYANEEGVEEAILSAATRHRHAMKDPAAKLLIETTQKKRTQRETEAAKAAKAAEQGLRPSGITASGATTFEAPPSARSNPELTALKGALGKMEADQISASTDTERMALEPKLKLLREKIASLEGAAGPTRWTKDANGKPVRVQ